MDFSLELFLIAGQPITKFIKKSAIHFEDGMRQDIYHKLDTIDVASQETQEKIIEFHDKLKRCYLCEENWFNKEIQWNLWY